MHAQLFQEYLSESPCPSPQHFPDPGIRAVSPAWQADSSPTEPPLNTKGRITSLHLAIWAPLVAQTVKSLPAMQET